MARRAVNALAFAAFVGLAPASALALAPQGGYTSESHPDLGLTFQRARDYEQIPTQPEEQYVVLKFGEKVPEKPAAKKQLRPEMLVVWIDFVPDPAAPRTRERGCVLSELVVEHVEPWHVRRVNRPRHSPFPRSAGGCLPRVRLQSLGEPCIFGRGRR